MEEWSQVPAVVPAAVQRAQGSPFSIPIVSQPPPYPPRLASAFTLCYTLLAVQGRKGLACPIPSQNLKVQRV